ncbi:MAG: triose-phosphate isomerase [Gammaproteobacteria bacterium]|nr:triose-phosphate isomerase [Gammaproteobacteria bacterium]MCZ6856229.1 triose-phosphate isomerase [Gammaproteobacteria bacterium]
MVLVAGNWKMHGSLSFVSEFAASFLDVLTTMGAHDTGCQVLIFPPNVYLGELARTFANSEVELGAQNLNPEMEGAFTGEVAGEMISDIGGRWVLVGHSERRQYFADNDSLVARKFAAALRAGLKPILCVGETLEERDAGQAEEVVRRQLQAVFDEVGVARFASGTVAYEPIWAIGTGRTASPQQAQEMHNTIRKYIGDAGTVAGTDAQTNEGQITDMQILYGGSVKPDNAAALFAEPDIDGGLVGGASLDPEAFAAIVNAACATAPARPAPG